MGENERKKMMRFFIPAHRTADLGLAVPPFFSRASCALIFFLGITLMPALSFSLVTDDECMECHSDKELVTEKEDGTQISLFVNLGVLNASTHKKLSCTSCHGEISSVPHDEKLPTVACEKCHASTGKKLAAGHHVKIKGGCKSCHGTHGAADPRSPAGGRVLAALCLDCHKDGKDVSFRQNAHSKAPRQGAPLPACSSCHDAHTAREPKGKTCASCHKKVVAELASSIHSKGLGARCMACHREHSVRSGAARMTKGDLTSCQPCHKDEALSYLRSIHGVQLARANLDVPTCFTCHGGHKILGPKNPLSPVSHTRIVKLCISCHEDEKVTARHGKMPAPAVIKAYEQSVHGRILATQGLLVAPTCTDCHGAHDLKPADEPKSNVARKNIPATCGRCHLLIYEKYQESVHGEALLKGIIEAPVCTDCHGEHSIELKGVMASKVSPENIPETCSRCHEEVGIVGKYGLSAKKLESYRDSFHGIANKYGKAVVANCASCHGFHDIRPSSDPRSATNPANLPVTCGKCHPGAGENFARGKIHFEVTRKEAPGVYFVRLFYTWFIAVLVLGFVIHIVLDLLGRRRKRRIG
ncbi:MAG: cytochrome c3 family protein [Candidatus Eisenbacteria bacterium]|nr:cytochrome c3 family protein [Candidatus Eisenbacteria bacterium]